MSENTTGKNALTMFINYREIPGALFCEWAHRRGLAFKIPKNRFRKELLEKFPAEGIGTFRDKGCIYILLGETGEGDERAYIGESTSIDTRLGTHAFSSKSWNWENVIIFCRNDHQFGKDELLYVEEQLIFKAWDADRFVISNDGKNKRKGATCGIKDLYKSAADEFVESIQLLCNALGHMLFEPKPPVQEAEQIASISPSPQEPESDLTIFTLKAPDGRYDARGRMNPDGKTFVVLAGSVIRQDETGAISDAAKAKREELQSPDSGVIKNCTFEQDYVFRSASAAASVITGDNVNAYKVWNGLRAFMEGGGDGK